MAHRCFNYFILVLLGVISVQNFYATIQWKSRTNSAYKQESDNNKVFKSDLGITEEETINKDYLKSIPTSQNSEHSSTEALKAETTEHLETTKTLKFTETSTRIGIVCFVPYKDNSYYIIAFTTFLYSSWKYVTSHSNLAMDSKLGNFSFPESLIVPDLLVWCSELACKQLPTDCVKYDLNATRDGFEPKCFYFPKEALAGAATNGWTNSFVHVSDPIFGNITSKYDYFIRLDTDTLIAPPMLVFKPQTDVVISRAGYCSEFAQKRLENISEKLNLTTQRVHNIASSWYSKSSIIHELSQLILRATLHMSQNEFDPKLPGLEGVFKDNPEGIWPLWWRGVSTMYGNELALNALVPNLHNCCWTEGLLDQSTCNSGNIMTAIQLHCYQSGCQFRKFDFLDSIIHIRDSRSLDPRLFRFYADRDVRNMTLRDYSTYIAWHGASRYVQHIHAWVKSALFETFADVP